MKFRNFGDLMSRQDGHINDVKLVRDGDGWKAIDFKARAFKDDAKDQLAAYLVRAYSEGRYDGPPRATEPRNLLKYRNAGLFARTALRRLGASMWEWLPDRWLLRCQREGSSQAAG